MSDLQRLDLIAEAVRYCQRVRALGMPANCWSKALREPIYFLWECRAGGNKEQRPQYRSRDAVGLRFGSRDLVYDHAIPFRYLQDELLALTNPTPASVASVLDHHRVGLPGLRSRIHRRPVPRDSLPKDEVASATPGALY